MEELDRTQQDALAFFAGREALLPVYRALEKEIFRRHPRAKCRVQRTQITFYERHVFACVSFLRLKKSIVGPAPCFVLTLGLPYPPASQRVAASVEPYPGRWTTHIAICTATQLDDEVFRWLDEAYAFSQSK